MFYIFACFGNNGFKQIHKSETVSICSVVTIAVSIILFFFDIWNWYLALSGRTAVEFLDYVTNRGQTSN